MTSRNDPQLHQNVRDAVLSSWQKNKAPELIDTVTYHPRESRSPALQNHNGWRATVVKLGPGVAMVLFADLTMCTARNDEMRATQ